MSTEAKEAGVLCCFKSAQRERDSDQWTKCRKMWIEEAGYGDVKDELTRLIMTSVWDVGGQDRCGGKSCAEEESAGCVS